MSDPLATKKDLLCAGNNEVIIEVNSGGETHSRVIVNEVINGQGPLSHSEPKSSGESHPLVIVFASISLVLLALLLTSSAAAPGPEREFGRHALYEMLASDLETGASASPS